MAYVYTAIIIVAVGFVFYKMVKKRKDPANHYVPFDSMVAGTTQDARKDDPLQDTKHQIDYQEETKSSDSV